MKKFLLLLSILAHFGQVNAQCTVTVNTATICSGQQSATLIAYGANSYSWAPSTGLSATTGSAVAASPSVTTSYTITGVAGTCTSTAITNVAVNSIPTVAFTPDSISGCFPLCTNFTAYSNPFAISFNWKFGDSTSSSNQSPAHCYSAAGIYTITLTVSDANGCVGLANGIVYATSCSGIENFVVTSEITIYPNPTSDQFYIETNATDKLNVDLYDVNGRHVFSASGNDKSNINVATLDNGIYTLTIKSVDGVTNKKLVIVR